MEKKEKEQKNRMTKGTEAEQCEWNSGSDKELGMALPL